jgi:hypothetical protein
MSLLWLKELIAILYDNVLIYFVNIKTMHEYALTRTSQEGMRVDALDKQSTQ